MNTIDIETARQIKKLGYDRPTLSSFYECEDGHYMHGSSDNKAIKQFLSENPNGKVYPEPTVEDVFGWLKSVFGILVCIEPRDTKDVSYQYKIFSVTDHSEFLEYHFEDSTVSYWEVQSLALTRALAYATIARQSNKIDFTMLNNELFPGFVWWFNGAEVCGLNFVTKQFIVIDDGACISTNKEWTVHCYQLEKVPGDWKSLKYGASENKIIEKRYKLAR